MARSTSILCRLVIIILAATVAVTASAEDGDAMTNPLAGLFDPASAVQPRPGDWFDYLVAYPVDPLENSLRSDPLAAPLDDRPPSLEDLPSDEEYFFFVPTFEPETAWKTIPLRLELREMDDAGINAILTVAGKSHQTRLARPDPREERPDFPFDSPQPEPSTVTVSIGAGTIEADVTRRIHEDYGFVRWTSRDIPFGLVRFATANVDIILIDHGRGTPPDFPPAKREEASPPLGALYRSE